MAKKLNAFTLSGLMIGPILGSGILFLPPLAYQKLGDHALLAWIITMAMGVLFAYVFSRMNAAAPSNQGMSALVGDVLGTRFGTLAANYLTAAVVFGPAAVAYIAAGFIGSAFPQYGVNQTVTAILIMAVSALLMMSDVSFVGKFMLALSTLAAGLLLAGSVITIARHPAITLPRTLPAVKPLGSTLLLLFWAIFGWEVLGNYAEDVADPQRTTMRAMKMSLFAIITVYCIAALALQQSGSDSMAALLTPVFGPYATTIFGLIAAGLCICTIVTFTGAAARQTAARLQARRMPVLVQKHQTAVLMLVLLNVLVLLCREAGVLTFENIVKSANCLFIGNAFLGLLSGFRLMRNRWIRIGIGVLLLMMAAIFLFSPAYAIVLFICITLASLAASRAARVPSCEGGREG